MGLLILATACGSSNSPSAPSTQTPQVPATTPNPTPAPTTASLSITPSTLQVAAGPTPATGFDCAGKPNFWQWEVTITETAGVPVTLTRGVTLADGQVLSTNTLSETIPARGSVTRRPFQCWAQGNGHAAQSTYSGTDANGHEVSVTSPIVTLMPRQ